MAGFNLKYGPGTQHRGLALMCAPATEDALVRFIEEHAATISLFRVTAPIPVLNRVRHLLGRNADAAVGVEVNYLGGDGQVATQIVLHDVGARPPWLVPSVSQPLPLTAELARPGAAIILRDPIGASGAACDCDALLRLINVHNIVNATNITTADMLVRVFAEAIAAQDGVSILPSFYTSLESPAVAAYQAKQNAVIASHGGKAASPAGEPIVARRISISYPGERDSVAGFTSEAELRSTLLRGKSLSDAYGSNDPGLEEASAALSQKMLGSSKNLLAPDPMRPRPLLKEVNRRSSKMLALSSKNMLSSRYLLANVEEAPQESPKDAPPGPGPLLKAHEMRCLALISHNNMKGET